MPRGYQPNGTIRGIVYCHAFGELGTSLHSFSNGPNKAQIMRALGEVYPIIGFDCGTFNQGGATDSNGWTNANSLTRLGQAITWLQNVNGGGAKTGKVALVGYSMGHALALAYAQANPANVSCILGLLPVNDLDDIRDNNRGTLRASIGTAFIRVDTNCGTTNASPTVTDPAIVASDVGRAITGPNIPANSFVGTVTPGVSFLLSSSASSQVNVNATGTLAAQTMTLTPTWVSAAYPALPATANPAKVANQTNLINIPQLIQYANDDAVCVPATATALIANIGVKCTGVNLGNVGGHVDAALAGVSIPSLLSFFATNNT
jgi:dienelactone hydrolase